MRKLSAVLLPVAAVGALVASTLAAAGPAAADPWGYGRSERHEQVDRYRGDRDRGGHESHRDWGHRDWGHRDGGHRYRDHRGR